MPSLPFDPTFDHTISREEAGGLIQAFRSSAAPGTHLSSAFNRSAFEKLLAQPGAAGIRIHQALEADGSPTMVMVAVDSKGADMNASTDLCMQNSSNCPPYCPQPWA
ncbi:MAG TPA: hypothetical protein VJ549_06450 [Geothrix sp.]|nr:hypothetical protein [Geothrix sp.]